MKRKSWVVRLIGLLLVSFLIFTGAVMAAAGSSEDPLVTLSYLNQKFLPQVLSEVDGKISDRNAALSKELSAQIKSDAAAFEKKYGTGSTGAESSSGTAADFTLVTMAKGQVLYGNIGCEVLLRVGTASCVADSAPGLIDETTAGSINSGDKLVKNHLYLMTINNRGVQSTADTVKVLVRGSYSIV